MDFLSNNPLLPKILSLLDIRDIQACRKVNRRFNFTVEKHSRILRKPEVYISINREEDLLEIDCDRLVDRPRAPNIISYPDRMRELMFRVTLGTDSIDSSGPRAKQFMDSLTISLHGLSDSSHVANEDKLSSTSENQLLRLQEVLILIFLKADVALLDLETDDVGNKNGQQLTDDDFACIAKCLTISKAKVERLYMARMSTLRSHFMPKPEWKNVRICLGQVPMRTEDILQIPNNFEKLSLETQSDKGIPDIVGIQTILKEWVQGKRNFKRLAIFLWCNRIKWYSPAALSDMLYEFPSFVKTSEDRYSIKGRICRSIDENELFLHFDHEYNNFELSLDPKSIFMGSDK